MSDLLKKSIIDLIDQFHVSWKQIVEQFNRPTLESFRQNRMICISKGLTAYLPSFIPFQLLLVNQESHQFRDCNRRMRIVKLNCHIIWEGPPRLIAVLKANNHILQGS